MKGYLAGSLFNKAEVNERLREGKLIKDEFPKEEWYNPIEAPINDKSTLPTAYDIFKGDYEEVKSSDVIIADLTNNDTGVAMELGIAIGINDSVKTIKEVLSEVDIDEEIYELIVKKLKIAGIKTKQIFAHNSDIRVKSSGEYDGNYVPYGQNQFVVGGVEYSGNKIFSSIEYILSYRKNHEE